MFAASTALYTTIIASSPTPPAISSTPNTRKPRKHRITHHQPHLDHRCDSSFSTHQRVHMSPAGPTTSINNESRGCFLIEKNNSWRVSILLACLVSTFNLTGYLSLKQRSPLQRLGHLSAATLAPHGSLPYLLAGRIIVASDTGSYYKLEVVPQQTASTEVTHGSVSVGQSQKQGSPPPSGGCKRG
jgi:hypothetical protein